jgi:prolyl-tRNA editing enzyme YbaK/EbsC (Cys-tRNA(Pro) deacylase)
MKVWREVVEDVNVEVLEFDDTVETVEKASRLSGYPPQMIIKTLLTRSDDNEYMIFIVRGDRRIDHGKVEKYFKKKIFLAKPDEVKRILGANVGAVTPLSSKIKTLKIIVDPMILEHEYVICGGGSLNRLYKIKTTDLIKYLNPQIIDLFK